MFDTLEEQILLSTVMLTFSNGDIGTGFLLELRLEFDNHEKYGQVYLVSNKHLIVNNKDCELKLSLHRNIDFTNIAGSIKNSDDILVCLKGKIFTPDSNVDLALVDISEYYDKNISHLLFYEELLNDFTSDQLLPFSDIYFVGYPRGQYDQQNNLPIVRKGIIASHPKFDYNGEPYFLIDANVYEGSSGSPVLIPINGQFSLIGIIAGTYKYNEPIKVRKEFSCSADEQIASYAQEVEIAYGLGVVIKSSCLLSFLNEIKKEITNRYYNGTSQFIIK